MKIKQIGLFLITALLIFSLGCPEDPDAPPKKEPEKGQEQVSVTFDMDGGTPEFGTITINKGASIGTSYMSPRKTDFAFAGWYDVNDITFTNKYIATTPINNNITLKARWGIAPTIDFPFANFNMGGQTNKESIAGDFNGRSNVTKISPKTAGTDYEWYVLTYLLDGYYDQLITITLDMWVYVSKDAKIVWQVNNGSNFPDTWGGGTWKIIAGDDKTPLDKETWFHLQGSAMGTPKQGSNAGNQVYVSGGGNGGQLANNPVDIYISDFSMTIAKSSIDLPPSDKFPITIGQKKDFKPLLNSNMTGTVTWSSNSSNVSVTNGIVTSNVTSFSGADGTSKYYTKPATVEATITATAGANTQTFSVIATTEGQEYITDLPPFKSFFPSNFLVGNIATTNDAGSVINNAKLTQHFNALTSENDMKPENLFSDKNNPNAYNWTNADKFVNAAIASNMKVIGHTLLWHSQIPQWQKDMAAATPEVALAAMKKYITDVVTHFKGKIYSWDVLNEVFPDSPGSTWSTAMRDENPWFKAIGSDFVYEGFLAARLADPGAILYYNDFNTDQSVKATVIRDMVKAVNDKYLAADASSKPAGDPAGRLLIEGIGMQEHHNTGISASNVKTTLAMFKAIGVKVAVTEIDVLGQGWTEFSAVGQGTNRHTNSTVTNNGLLTQANLYGQFMAVYMEYKDTIERISIWGVTDNTSWRSAGLPLLFDANGKAKPAYYKFVGGITALPW
jgi:GH35 family endo-1,4-beta-xylanase